MRVVLDTNVIVAGMAYPLGPPGRIVGAWRKGSLQVVLSAWILTECARILPRLGRFTTWSERETRDLVDGLALSAEQVDPDAAALQTAHAAQVRDRTDEPVLAALIASAAEMLITGDKDLLVLADRYPILSPTDFCARFLR